MVIFSATEAVEVDRAVVNGAALVVAQMPNDLLERFAELLKVEFYSRKFCPSNGKSIIIKHSIPRVV